MVTYKQAMPHSALNLCVMRLTAGLNAILLSASSLWLTTTFIVVHATNSQTRSHMIGLSWVQVWTLVVMKVVSVDIYHEEVRIGQTDVLERQYHIDSFQLCYCESVIHQFFGVDSRKEGGWGVRSATLQWGDTFNGLCGSDFVKKEYYAIQCSPVLCEPFNIKSEIPAVQGICLWMAHSSGQLVCVIWYLAGLILFALCWNLPMRCWISFLDAIFHVTHPLHSLIMSSTLCSGILMVILVIDIAKPNHSASVIRRVNVLLVR